MKIHIKTVIDMETGIVVEDQSYHYDGPVALCDRSLVSRAKTAQDQAAQAAGAYGAQAGQTGGFLTPQLEKWTVSPPGYGALGLGQMETSAVQAARGRQGAMEEASRLRALRTGNAAGLGSLEAAEAQGGARGAGSAVEDILAKNAMLKASQQESAQRGLEGMYGTEMRGQLGAMGQQAEDINTATRASQTGWLQNAEGIVKTLQGMGSYSKGGFTVGGGGQ